jgi:2-succinyl-5-enolpyruvyl-6-hydroxy-3-cyclohexene-1-carboxylate synthase
MSRDQFVWIETFTDALVQAGIRDLVVCPGSRSTPLTLAAEVTSGLVCHRAVDERAAAFYALGQARVTGRPSAVVCTSGTAAAHFLPAVIEANQSFIPLLLLTADRPWELIGVAAPQTMDQHALFGVFARGFFELGGHDPGLSDAMAGRVAAQAVARCLGPTPGPVQVNVRLRKPLEPAAPWPNPEREPQKHRRITAVFPPARAASPEAISALIEQAKRAKRGLIVCGPAPLDRNGGSLRTAAIALAKATGFVLFAETTSQARFGPTNPEVIECPSFDVVLRDPILRKSLALEMIIELGAPPTSGTYAEFLQQQAHVPRFVVAEHGWNDPAQDATALVMADPAQVCRRMVDALKDHCPTPDPTWRALLQRADAIVWEAAEKHAGNAGLTEALVARTVISTSPREALLVVGNSLPVRDVDMWAPARREHLDVLHQRGVSGIDGLIAGAAGAASIANPRPVVLLLGDTSTLHDLTSLALARRATGPLVIVVVQNQGGRIFERLPIVRAIQREHFDKYFTMHEAVDLADAAAAFDVPFVRTDSTPNFVQAFAQALVTRGPTLIEAVVPPEDGTARVNRFRAEIVERLRALVEEASR